MLYIFIIFVNFVIYVKRIGYMVYIYVVDIDIRCMCKILLVVVLVLCKYYFMLSKWMWYVVCMWLRFSIIFIMYNNCVWCL